MTGDPLLDAVALSERWGISMKTLANWRSAGTGPKYMKLGSAVRYRLSDVEAYEESNLMSYP